MPQPAVSTANSVPVSEKPSGWKRAGIWALRIFTTAVIVAAAIVTAGVAGLVAAAVLVVKCGVEASLTTAVLVDAAAMAITGTEVAVDPGARSLLGACWIGIKACFGFGRKSKKAAVASESAVSQTFHVDGSNNTLTVVHQHVITGQVPKTPAPARPTEEGAPNALVGNKPPQTPARFMSSMVNMPSKAGDLFAPLSVHPNDNQGRPLSPNRPAIFANPVHMTNSDIRQRVELSTQYDNRMRDCYKSIHQLFVLIGFDPHEEGFKSGREMRAEVRRHMEFSVKSGIRYGEAKTDKYIVGMLKKDHIEVLKYYFRQGELAPKPTDWSLLAIRSRLAEAESFQRELESVVITLLQKDKRDLRQELRALLLDLSKPSCNSTVVERHREFLSNKTNLYPAPLSYDAQPLTTRLTH